MIGMSLVKDIALGVVAPVTNLIDELHTSVEEKLTLKAKLMEIQTQAMSLALEFEAENLKTQASVILAEAKGHSAIQRLWRPITMLSFVSLILYKMAIEPFLFWILSTWTDVPSPPVIEVPSWVGNAITVGLGGYVIGRSVEKVAPAVVEVFKRSEGESQSRRERRAERRAEKKEAKERRTLS